MNQWLRGPATDCTGSSVGRQRERENADVSDGGARCSTMLVGVTIPAIATTTRAISAAGAAAVQTHATGNASTLATCSWTTSTCRAAPNASTFSYRGHDYTLRGSESRTLTSVGAFRVVPAHDLRDTLRPAAGPTAWRAVASARFRTRRDRPPRPRHNRRHADEGRTRSARIPPSRRRLAATARRSTTASRSRAN